MSSSTELRVDDSERELVHISSTDIRVDGPASHDLTRDQGLSQSRTAEVKRTVD